MCFSLNIKNLSRIGFKYMSRVLQLGTCKNINDLKLCLEYHGTDVLRCRRAKMDGQIAMWDYFVDVSKTVN